MEKEKRPSKEPRRSQCGVRDNIKFVKRRKKESNDHVTRVNNDRLVKIVRDNKSADKKNIERLVKKLHVIFYGIIVKKYEGNTSWKPTYKKNISNE